MSSRPRGWRTAWRYSLTMLLALASIGMGIPVAFAQPLPSPVVSAEAAVLMDYQTGHVLYSYQASKKLPPASTTKVLTALMGLEMGQVGEIVTISEHASGTEGTSLELRPGLGFDLRDLIKGALVNSGNDAAVAIGEHLAGNENFFASLMTYKAMTIGAAQSNFVNPNGLDNPGHYCSAYDLALITRYALNNQLFRRYVQTKDDVIYEHKTHAPVHLNNTNRLLWGDGKNGKRGFRVIGVKTGTTSSAGQCLVSAADQDGATLIAVVLGSTDRYADTLSLLQYGYEKCRWYRLSGGEGLFKLPVDRGAGASVTIAPVDDVCFAVAPQEASILSKQVEIKDLARAPIPSGALVGRITFYLGDRLLFGTRLKTLTSVAKKSILF